MTTPMTEPVLPSRVIRCTGFGCSKKLADVVGLELVLKCPRCGALRRVSLSELTNDLLAALVEIQRAAGADSAGGGFLL